MSLTKEEEEDIEFEKLLSDKQHREMMSSLKTLVQCLEKLESSDSAMVKAIQKHSQSVVDFIDKIGDQKPPTITLNQDQVTKEIKVLSTQLGPFLEELKALSVQFKESIEVINNKKPVEWEFTVDRGFNQRIEKIIAKPKNS